MVGHVTAVSIGLALLVRLIFSLRSTKQWESAVSTDFEAALKRMHPRMSYGSDGPQVTKQPRRSIGYSSIRTADTFCICWLRAPRG